MGFFDLFRGPDINQGLKEFQSATDAVLLDVRTPQEYSEGHLPESKNIPLQTIGNKRITHPGGGIFIVSFSLLEACVRRTAVSPESSDPQHDDHKRVDNIRGCVSKVSYRLPNENLVNDIIKCVHDQSDSSRYRVMGIQFSKRFDA